MDPSLYMITSQVLNMHFCLAKGPGSGLFPSGDVDLEGAAMSPLQRMASITNSLVSQPSMPGQCSQNRPRASLPPITQQQFDRFSHLNTDEVVRRVSSYFYLLHYQSTCLYNLHCFFLG
jgi:hypothetical protein